MAKSKKKRIAYVTSRSVLGVAVAVCLGCDLLVSSRTGDYVFDDVQALPYNKVGLLLGTSRYSPSGGPNLYFNYRILAAAQLFKQGKIDYILVSGDNRSKDYDEPTWMRDALVAQGVPPERIELDYAGLRTLDSVVRAKEIFGLDRFTVISQKFHNERAVYLARHKGIRAVAYNAKDVKRADKWLKIHSRELLARVKMFIDLATHKAPRHLGEKVNI